MTEILTISQVQLQEKLMIYEQQEGEQLHYVIKEKINQNFECSLMVICTNHIILCHVKLVQLFGGV